MSEPSGTLDESDEQPSVVPPAVFDGATKDAWVSVWADADFKKPVAEAVANLRPSGEDLDLGMGWERFEKFILSLSQGTLGLRNLKFRRYGVRGQAQKGIDLAGRAPDGVYTVIQCKEYATFTVADLKAAVKTFADGDRPFSATRLIVATSADTQSTQVADALSNLQDKYPDLDIELWGAEQINESLRSRGDLVARFWGPATAEAFCTIAPTAGVPAPPLDRQTQAEQILMGPLNTNDLMPKVTEAEAQLLGAPGVAASLYGDIAGELDSSGFRGHAQIMRERQLGALRKGEFFDEAADLAGHLAALAIHRGDRDTAHLLSRTLNEIAAEATGKGTAGASDRVKHAALIEGALNMLLHPLGDRVHLIAALSKSEGSEPVCHPVLVLLLAEHALAFAPELLADLDVLIVAAIAAAPALGAGWAAGEVLVRLRLVRAEYDADMRSQVNADARLHRLPGRQTALIAAREARRSALTGLPDEALEGWRDAINDAIHAGMADDAADWLYAVRWSNTQYGPWSHRMDEEHRLAQALRSTGSERLLERSREPRDLARASLVGGRPIDAVLSARQWLVDSVITGKWANENYALQLLAQLYRSNGEPVLAASLYERAGRQKELTAMAAEVGDLKLPVVVHEEAPWWVAQSWGTLASEQRDLLSDAEASELLGFFTDTARKGRHGELVDSPFHALTERATKTACDLGDRGTAEQALKLLDLLASDVPREPNHYRPSDDHHAKACVAIALAHPDLAFVALTRLFDLADNGVDKALRLIGGDAVVELVEELADTSTARRLTPVERQTLRDRITVVATNHSYYGQIALARTSVEPVDPEHAAQARDRILARPEPNPSCVQFGSRLVPDSFLVSSLKPEEQISSLEKLLDVAEDQREGTPNRQDALGAARNLTLDQPAEEKAMVFRRSQAFIDADVDGSKSGFMDGPSHPLSSFKFDMGSMSLLGPALLLAQAAATTDEQHQQVLRVAVAMLHSTDDSDIHDACMAMSRLPIHHVSSVDVNLLSSHQNRSVRQVSAVLCAQQPTRFKEAAELLAKDPDAAVRRTLAQAAADAAEPRDPVLERILAALAQDVRRNVRSATIRSGA